MVSIDVPVEVYVIGDTTVLGTAILQMSPLFEFSVSVRCLILGAGMVGTNSVTAVIALVMSSWPSLVNQIVPSFGAANE